MAKKATERKCYAFCVKIPEILDPSIAFDEIKNLRKLIDICNSSDGFIGINVYEHDPQYQILVFKTFNQAHEAWINCRSAGGLDELTSTTIEVCYIPMKYYETWIQENEKNGKADC